MQVTQHSQQRLIELQVFTQQQQVILKRQLREPIT